MGKGSWLVLPLALALAAGGRPDATGRHEPAPAAVVLRVLSYNIHHGEGLDGRIDLSRQAEIMKREEPDLVALQEVDRGTVRSGSVDQLAELARLTGLAPVFGQTIALQGGDYGVGVLSRLAEWTLLEEVGRWHDATDHRIYTARVRDRFGDMGVVCCCVAKLEADALHVPVFVLSCRVFGYGVETAVLERLKQDAARHFGAPRLRGQLVHTDHNKPCRSMYADHGFREQAPGVWQYDGGPALAPQPVWFEQISATG